jgi:threonine dehydratase
MCCVISGGNLDVNILKRVITYGQIFSHRMMRLRVFVNDRPGELADILKLLGQAKANVIEVQHNRLLTATQFQNVQIDLDLETTGERHQERIKAALLENHINFEVSSNVGNLI